MVLSREINPLETINPGHQGRDTRIAQGAALGDAALGMGLRKGRCWGLRCRSLTDIWETRPALSIPLAVKGCWERGSSQLLLCTEMSRSGGRGDVWFPFGDVLCV